MSKPANASGLPHLVGATLVSGGKNTITIDLKKGEKTINIVMDCSSPDTALTVFSQLTLGIQDAVDQDGQQEGGQGDA